MVIRAKEKKYLKI